MTAETTWGRYSKLRFKLQQMHNDRIARAKKTNKKLRKSSRSKRIIYRARKIDGAIKKKMEAKLSNPNFNKDKKKFEYVPYIPPQTKREIAQ